MANLYSCEPLKEMPRDLASSRTMPIKVSPERVVRVADGVGAWGAAEDGAGAFAEPLSGACACSQTLAKSELGAGCVLEWALAAVAFKLGVRLGVSIFMVGHFFAKLNF